MIEHGPRACVLITDGTNCDREMATAITLAGARPTIVHVNELKARDYALQNDFEMLLLPGGFADADAVSAGKMLAIRFQTFLADQVTDFVNRGGVVFGECNGFQVLVKSGLLPGGELDHANSTLAPNDIGHFYCGWSRLNVEQDSVCKFIHTMDPRVSFQVAHGEGKFIAPPDVLKTLEAQRQVVFRYCDAAGNPTQDYPDNPNGSLRAIAGICDPSGRILGMMPHPTRSTSPAHNPNWRRQQDRGSHGLPLFVGMVTYAKQM